jgi:hypothetical protein
VVTVTTDRWDAQTAEIPRLVDFAKNEDAAIQQLETGLAERRRVRAAKPALRAFPPSELREALDVRRDRAQESVS